MAGYMAAIMMVLITGLLFIEVLLSGRWNPTYFRRGIPIFYKIYQAAGLPIDPFHSKTLTSAFRGWLVPPLVFKEIGQDEYAFREGLFQFVLLTYTPVMHGILNIDQGSGAVTVVGRVNWITLVFLLGCVVFGFYVPYYMLLPIFSVLLVLYGIQVCRFHKVGKIASGWSSKA